ncbi:DUF981 family protein [Nocardioides houyundeii]|uniref:DUF981 family protein n=1 Tax=Nocardioides houyundeii TaxID=2045452 RepID=UPI000DF29065|nr:DUF981 family protein [Nocardioides houyundeii]
MITLAAQEGLTIDWANMPTYNTIMAVAVGAGLIGLVQLGRQLRTDPTKVSTEGWAVTFGLLGAILAATGLHMTLTWPLAAGGFPFDNIIFGETSLGFGALLLGTSFYLWKRGAAALATSRPVETLARVAQPVTVFVGGLGLSLLAIAVAGVKYELFAAPPQEPISGEFADYPLVEAIFMSGLIALVGLGALAFAFLVNRVVNGRSTAVWARVTGWLWAVSGVLFLLFGAMNFFTHIGLIVNTM